MKGEKKRGKRKVKSKNQNKSTTTVALFSSVFERGEGMAGRGRGKEVERRASPRGRHRRSAHASVALIPAEGAFVNLGETLFIWRPPLQSVPLASMHLGGTSLIAANTD